jgi:glycerol-3-phosphate acyltransferase PlsY
MLITLFMAVMAYVRHWSNIKRLIAGNESKTYFSKKKKAAAAAKK